MGSGTCSRWQCCRRWWGCGRSVARVGGGGGGGGAAALLLAHAIGFVLLFRPAVFPAPWGQLKGYEPWVMKAWMAEPLAEVEGIASARQGRWALWAGTSAARRMSEEELGDWSRWSAAAERQQLSGVVLDEYWRGFGVGLLLRQTGSPEAAIWEVEGAPNDVKRRVWEGTAMGVCYAGQTGHMGELLAAADFSLHPSIWYGLGRSDVYCRGLATNPHLRDPEFEADFWRGYEDGWRLDYASPRGAREFDREFVDAVRIY